MGEDSNLRAVRASDVKQASKALLQKQLYAIFTTPTDGLGPVFANIEAHLEFQVELERKGIMFAAGPMWTDDEQSWEGEGLVIIRAATRDEAIEIAERDPMHKSGARTFKVRPWMINEGAMTVRIDFSRRNSKLADRTREEAMKKLLGLMAGVFMALPGAASAQETINLTVASSHPTVVPWVGMIKTHFMARTDEILAKSGKYKIAWNEAFGGQLYKANATLSSVEEGITDVGWVFSFLEQAKLPLSQVSTNTPFTVTDSRVLLEVMENLVETNEAFRNEWESHNLKVLGLTATDLYDIYTKKPLDGIAGINGMKLSAPGVLGNWLRGTGANAVDGALTTFYTDIQTGVSDGVLTLALGALPVKLYEVAPYIHRFDAAAAFSGAVAINKDSWDGLPEEVQNAMIEAGQYYTVSHGKDLVDRHEFALNKMVELGASQSPPVTIIPMPAEERQKWVDLLPNIASEWAENLEAEGVPAKAFLKEYMSALRAKGVTPSRNWDEGL